VARILHHWRISSPGYSPLLLIWGGPGLSLSVAVIVLFACVMSVGARALGTGTGGSVRRFGANRRLCW
jgi:hypothetical protein